jgi:hypothetical protein
MEARNSKNGKGVTRKHDKKMDFRLSQDEWKAMVVQAKGEHCSTGDAIRTAITDDLFKEINDADLIIEHLPKIKREIKRTRENVELSCELFIYWLKYFFAYTPSFSGKEEKVKQTKTGETMKNRMLDLFKKDKAENKKSWLEQLIMEYFEYGSGEGGTIG